jgi:hypothetical protein
MAEEGAHLDFTIARAWYQTICFRMLYVLAFICPIGSNTGTFTLSDADWAHSAESRITQHPREGLIPQEPPAR